MPILCNNILVVARRRCRSDNLLHVPVPALVSEYQLILSLVDRKITEMPDPICNTRLNHIDSILFHGITQDLMKDNVLGNKWIHVVRGTDGIDSRVRTSSSRGGNI